MLDFLEPNMSGNEWEKICNSCYRIRYQNEGYQEIPAGYRGDGGIEGFTRTGIVYQCYCPEKNYTTQEQYEHMRDKMTADIKKLLTPSYAKVLTEMGINAIKQWHFVVPEYSDRRILIHAAKKKQEVLEYKKTHLKQCCFISDDFDILLKIAEDFIMEISMLVRKDIGIKLDFTTLLSDEVDWSKCDTDKINNVKRKIKAIMNNCSEEDEDYKELVNIFMNSYVIGIELLEKLQREQIDTYEQIVGLELSKRRDVSIRTKTNMDSALNSKIFYEILKDFEKEIENQLPQITKSSIPVLRESLISSWLADCTMQFRVR